MLATAARSTSSSATRWSPSGARRSPAPTTPTAPSGRRSRCTRRAKPSPASGGEGLPPIGSTRVGLHRGEAVVGNFGGEGRIQYTALGDGMNTAARLESANKSLKTDHPRQRRGQGSNRASTSFARWAGSCCPAAPPRSRCGSRCPRWTEELRRTLVEYWARFDAGDLSALRRASDRLSAANKDDAALANFVYRIREAGPGGHFVLGSK